MSKPELNLDLQIASDNRGHQLPTLQQFEVWIAEVLASVGWENNTEVTVRVVDLDEMITLNETYRKKQGPTNVLSFPFSPIEGVELPLLGDIVICAAVIVQESEQQAKSAMDHWAHMVVHGMLHLLGFDHLSNKQANEMEQLEISILGRFKILNPYGDTQNL